MGQGSGLLVAGMAKAKAEAEAPQPCQRERKEGGKEVGEE